MVDGWKGSLPARQSLPVSEEYPSAALSPAPCGHPKIGRTIEGRGQAGITEPRARHNDSLCTRHGRATETSAATGQPPVPVARLAVPGVQTPAGYVNQNPQIPAEPHGRP